MAIIRHVWEHVQAVSPLGVTVTGSSTVRIGTEKKDVSFETGAGRRVDFEAGPYHLYWWDYPSCGKAITDLGVTAGREFTEWSAWNSDRSAITKQIRYVPRVGKRLNLRFEQDVNVSDVVEVVADSADYANNIIALGAGEGAKALRVTIPAPDTRLRVDRVIEMKDVTSKAVLTAAAQAELKSAQKRVRVAAVELRDHPMAEFGTFDVGDEVLVDVDTEWSGRVTQWSRILEIDWVGDSMKIAVEAV